MSEDEKEYIIDAELPGMKKSNIDIHAEDNQLVIHAFQDEESEQKEQNYIHKERRFVSRRAVYLPNIDSDGIKAKYEDGILSITVPKRCGQKESKS